MLLYKCDHAGVWFEEVDEAFSTQTCSRCNSRAGPKGRKDLGIRGWQCTVCEASMIVTSMQLTISSRRDIAVLPESSALEGRGF